MRYAGKKALDFFVKIIFQIAIVSICEKEQTADFLISISLTTY